MGGECLVQKVYDMTKHYTVEKWSDDEPSAGIAFSDDRFDGVFGWAVTSAGSMLPLNNRGLETKVHYGVS